MVEFALVIPMFLLITLGIFEISRLIFIYSTVELASHEAARYGSVMSSADARGVPQYGDCTGIRDAAMNVDFFNLLSDSNIQISYDSGPGTSTYSTCPTSSQTGGPTTTQVQAHPFSRVIIQVTGSYTPALGILPIPSFDISTTAARTIFAQTQIIQ